MIYVNAVGLGKSKLLKKIQIKKVGKALKKVSIKNAVKVVKFAAPIAAGFIPLGGGVAGKLTSKLVNSKAGKLVSKVGKTKALKKVVKVSKTKVGSFVAAKAKTAAKNKLAAKRPIAKVAAKRPIANKGSSSTIYPASNDEIQSNATDYPGETNATDYPGESISNQEQDIVEEPVGVLTPVKQAAVSRTQNSANKTSISQGTSSKSTKMQNENEEEEQDQIKSSPSQFTNSIIPQGAAPKSNTMMYVGGAVVLAGIVYLATKKSK